MASTAGLIAGTFKEAWAKTVWPHISEPFDKLVTERPRKQTDGALGTHFSSEKILGCLNNDHALVRNVSINMLWAKVFCPFTPNGENVSFETVRAFALQNFVKEADRPTPGEASAVAAAAAQHPPLTIPDVVPSEWTMKVVIFAGATSIPRTELETFGPDVARFGTFLVWAWALEDGDEAAAETIVQLILDWPADFKFYTDRSDVLQGALAFCQGVETARDVVVSLGIVCGS